MKIIDWLYKVKLYSIKNKYIYNDCYIILQYILNKSRIWIELNMNFTLNNNIIEYLDFFLIIRLRGEPICYILNRCFFFNIEFKIYNDVFIPRSSTEYMVSFIIKFIKFNNIVNILDLGSGSGVISYCIAKNCINTFILCVDIDKICISLIKYNIRKLKLYNIKYLRSNWFNKINKNNLFDLIICNPPYIWSKDKCLNNKDLRYESYISLVSNKKGFEDINYIIKNSYFYLKNSGWLIIEHSFLNLEYIILLFNKYFFNVYTYKCYIFNSVFTIGQKLIF